jgi:hypothetical protein
MNAEQLEELTKDFPGWCAKRGIHNPDFPETWDKHWSEFLAEKLDILQQEDFGRRHNL